MSRCLAVILFCMQNAQSDTSVRLAVRKYRFYVAPSVGFFFFFAFRLQNAMKLIVSLYRPRDSVVQNDVVFVFFFFFFQGGERSGLSL